MNAASHWQDATPDSLPPLGHRVLCYSASQDRLFVARRTFVSRDEWRWQWGTDAWVPTDMVDQWAAITLRDGQPPA